MAETIETMPETIETIPKIEEEKEAPVVEKATPEPKKTRGRPKGASDKAPRKKKIVVVESPAQDTQASSSAPPAPVAPPAPTPAPSPEPDPPSPRTTMREASKSILQLRTLRDLARKSHLSTMYTEKLHRLT